MSIIFYQGAECPISEPNEREASRFATRQIAFSFCGNLLFGCNDNGSIFVCLSLGCMVPMKFMDIPDVPRDYLNIQPIKLTHDDLMKAPKVFHSMFLSEKDSILSFCNGLSIHLIKYPKLDYVTRGFSNPFLSQECFSCIFFIT